MDDVRRCSECKTFSSKSSLFKDITKTDGYRPECKFCTNEYHSKKREKEIYVKKKEKQ